MRWLVRILAALVVIVAVAAGASYLLPRHVEVTRSTMVDAAPETIFPLISNLKTAQEWSPWIETDPDIKLTYEGAPSGEGQVLKWDSPEMGSGSQTVTAVSDNQSVTSALDFGDMGTAEAKLSLAPSGGTTEVTWSLDADMGNNPIGRYMGFFMDDLVGEDYEKGLARLKSLAEARQTAAPAPLQSQ